MENFTVIFSELISKTSILKRKKKSSLPPGSRNLQAAISNKHFYKDCLPMAAWTPKSSKSWTFSFMHDFILISINQWTFFFLLKIKRLYILTLVCNDEYHGLIKLTSKISYFNLDVFRCTLVSKNQFQEFFIKL